MLGLKTAAILMELMKSITTTLRGVSLDVYMYIIEKLDQHMHWKQQSHIQMTQKQQQMHNLSLNLAGDVYCVVCCDMYMLNKYTTFLLGIFVTPLQPSVHCLQQVISTYCSYFYSCFLVDLVCRNTWATLAVRFCKRRKSTMIGSRVRQTRNR